MSPYTAFGILVGVTISTFIQFDIRDREGEAAAQDRISKKMDLLSRATAIDSKISNLQALESRVNQRLAQLEDKADKTIDSAPDDYSEPTKFTDDRPTGHN